MSKSDFEVPSGRGGRAARLAVSSVYSGLAPAILLLTSRGAEGVLHLISIAFVLITVWLWIRLPFTGADVKGDVIVFHSWWSRQRLRRDDLVKFHVGSYGGPFYYLAWAVDNGPFESGQLEVEFVDGSRRTIRGAVCSRRVSHEIARSLNGWLEANSGSLATPRSRIRRAKGKRSGRDQGELA